MRVAGLVVLGAAVAGKPMSCNQWAEGEGNVVVTFELPQGPGSSGVELRGCRGWTAGEDRIVIPPGRSGCALVGWRQDGQLKVESEPVPLDSRQLEQHVVFDTLPEGPIGGMGALVDKISYGVRIERVLWGLPAHHAGIVPGEVVLAVDDQPTAPMSTTAFIRALTGPPGERVTLSVETLQRTIEERSFVRERIP